MIKITADSTCDLSPEILAELDITLAPLYINAGEDSFRDGVDITPADVFRHVETKKTMCSTSAVNIFDYETLFGKFSPECGAVIHLCISMGFSTCYQNAVTAAAGFPNVYPIDTRNLSSGSGTLVMDAALMARDGVSAEEICRKLEEDIPKVDCSFVIDRMDYLHKGGRCSGMEALGAKLLSIKPCIEVFDGAMRVGKKYFGKFDKCLEQYVGERLADKDAIDPKRVFITHPMCSEETVEAVRAAIARHMAFDEVIETKAGCTVSSHCGPSTLGIIFKRL